VSVVDANPDAARPPAERCTTKYGGVGQFELCSSTETSCTFYVNVGGGGGQPLCGEICGPLGGTCIDNTDGDCQNPGNPQLCMDGHTDQVCTCSL
jgi:hypothetical protein